MVDPDDEPQRKPRDPLDDFFRGMGVDPSAFDSLFDDMQRALGRMLKEGGFEPGKPYMHGFNFKIGPDGKPHISEFGNRPRRDPTRKAVSFSEEREPPTDVIESEADIAVTLEMPGIEKSEIDVRTTERMIEISVDTESRKYHKRIELPVKVQPTTTKATYKNGVLDIVVKKSEPSPADSGHRVVVD